MPRKRAPALLQKLSNLLKISIFLAKLKKPIIPKLVFLKNTSRRLKKFKLLSQYSYYVKEYEFSPSSTPPLIQFQRKTARNGRISFRKLYSDAFFISECLGLKIRAQGKKEKYCLESGLELEPYLGFVEPELGRDLGIDSSSEEDDDDDCVDEKAERFIQSFYEEMRRQKMESSFQINAMLAI